MNCSKKDARDKLHMYHGTGKHDTGSNICRSDGYFALSLERNFGMCISDLGIWSGYDAEIQDVRANFRSFIIAQKDFGHSLKDIAKSVLDVLEQEKMKEDR